MSVETGIPGGNRNSWWKQGTVKPLVEITVLLIYLYYGAILSYMCKTHKPNNLIIIIKTAVTKHCSGPLTNVSNKVQTCHRTAKLVP